MYIYIYIYVYIYLYIYIYIFGICVVDFCYIFATCLLRCRIFISFWYTFARPPTPPLQKRSIARALCLIHNTLFTNQNILPYITRHYYYYLLNTLLTYIYIYIIYRERVASFLMSLLLQASSPWPPTDPFAATSNEGCKQ